MSVAVCDIVNQDLRKSVPALKQLAGVDGHERAAAVKAFGVPEHDPTVERAPKSERDAEGCADPSPFA